tara:strand:+ start:186 stop:1013 length:828 start_codon:yes stop_codon:yes gene_type:complete
MKNLNDIQPASSLSTQGESFMDKAQIQYFDFNEALVQHFKMYVEETGNGNFTSFKKHMDELMKEHIKPLTFRSQLSASDGESPRAMQKAMFKGRGKQWIFVSHEDIVPTLDALKAQGIDTEDYETHIARLGQAWIRYNGPRVVDGKLVGAFEVRTQGSKIDHPKQLHYIDNDLLGDVVRLPDGATPHSLKLEIDPAAMPAAPKPKAKKAKKTKPKAEAAPTPVVEEEVSTEPQEVIEAPVSDDPADWEDFLAQEGLAAIEDDLGDDIDDSLFGEF